FLAAAGMGRKPAPSPEPAPAQPQQINAKGVALIKDGEKLRLRAYNFGGRWYIGYGHLTKRPEAPITTEKAEHLLPQDLKICENAVRDSVQPSITNNQFSALTALCYNIGAPNFRATRVVKRLNAGDHYGAADAFLLLTKADVYGKPKKLAALEERRKAERALF